MQLNFINTWIWNITCIFVRKFNSITHLKKMCWNYYNNHSKWKRGYLGCWQQKNLWWRLCHHGILNCTQKKSWTSTHVSSIVLWPLNWSESSIVGYEHSCIFRFGGRFGLTIGMVYFSNGQYRRFVLGFTAIYIYLFIYMFIHQNL